MKKLLLLLFALGAALPAWSQGSWSPTSLGAGRCATFTWDGSDAGNAQPHIGIPAGELAFTVEVATGSPSVAFYLLKGAGSDNPAATGTSIFTATATARTPTKVATGGGFVLDPDVDTDGDGGTVTVCSAGYTNAAGSGSGSIAGASDMDPASPDATDVVCITDVGPPIAYGHCPAGVAAAHAISHSAGGADEVQVEDLGTAGAVGTAPVVNGANSLAMTDIATQVELGTHAALGTAHGTFAGGASDGGPALSGDSATAFFSTGTLEDARIDAALHRDAEVKDGDLVSFDDGDSNFTATDVDSALEELDDLIGGGVPNQATGKVSWSQLVDVPAGFADNTDDGAGGGGDSVSIDGVAAVDPDFTSDGELDAIRCTGAGAPDASCVAAEDVIYRLKTGVVDADAIAAGALTAADAAADLATQAELDALSSVYQPLDADLTELATAYNAGTDTLTLASGGGLVVTGGCSVTTSVDCPATATPTLRLEDSDSPDDTDDDDDAARLIANMTDITGDSVDSELGVWVQVADVQTEIAVFDGAGLAVVGTVAATTITGANVTSGADPGHTHTGASISGLATADITSGELFDLYNNCVIENDGTPIPDACVGDGVDGGGGGGALSDITDPTADADFVFDAGEEFLAQFTGNFTTGIQFQVQQLTGNPTGGTLFGVINTDADVLTARIGDTINGLEVRGNDDSIWIISSTDANLFFEDLTNDDGDEDFEIEVTDDASNNSRVRFVAEDGTVGQVFLDYQGSTDSLVLGAVTIASVQINSDGTGTNELVVPDDSIGPDELDNSLTLAGNPAMAAEECIFTTDGAGGGGFICEGTTGANTNEQLYLFPAVDGADTTNFIAVHAAQVTDLAGAGLTVTAGVLDVDAAQRTRKIAIPVVADSSGAVTHVDLRAFFSVGDAVTLVRVTCWSGQANGFTIDVVERTESTPTTGTTGSLTTPLACDSDGAATTSFADSAVDADDLVFLDLTAESLAAGEYGGATIEYTVN